MTKRMLQIGMAVVLAGAVTAWAPAPEDIPGTVTLREEGSPFVSFNIWVKAGSQDDPAGKEGLASLTASLLSDGGTQQDTYEEIVAKLYPMATGYGVSVDKEMTNFQGTVHIDNLEPYYELLRNALLSPAFDAADFERYQSVPRAYFREIDGLLGEYRALAEEQGAAADQVHARAQQIPRGPGRRC